MRYADVFAATLAANYAGDPNVVGADIPSIDYPLGMRTARSARWRQRLEEVLTAGRSRRT